MWVRSTQILFKFCFENLKFNTYNTVRYMKDRCFGVRYVEVLEVIKENSSNEMS